MSRKLPFSPALFALLLAVAGACTDGSAAQPTACDGCRIGRVREDAPPPAAVLERGVVTAPAGGTQFAIIDADSAVLRLHARGVVVEEARLPDGVRIRELLVLQWPHRLVFSGRALGTNALFMGGVQDGRLVLDRAFVPPAPPRRDRAPHYVLAADPDGGFHAVDATSHTRLRYDTNGELVRRVSRAPAWFGNPERGLTRQRAAVVALDVDAAGRLWIFTRQPTQAAAAAWRTEEARQAGGRIIADPLDLYRTVVSVMSPEGDSVLATGWLAAEVLDVSNGVAWLRERDAQGNRQISGARLSLLDPQQRQEEES